MKHSLPCAGAALIAAFTLTGCIDKNYDLSDIDTTTRLKVNDLVIPVNIDPIQMGDILKFDDESKIQPVTIDGKEFYALVQSGDFTSDQIDVKPVHGAAEPMYPTYSQITLQAPGNARHGAPAMTLNGVINEVGNDFEFSATGIDNAIERVDYVEALPFRFTMHISLEAAGASISKVTYTDVKIRAPKGLTCTASTGSYDKATGIWTIPSITSNGATATLTLTATGINTVLAEAPLKADHSLTFDGEFRIESAKAAITAEASSVPTHTDLTLSYEIEDFEATAFSGRIHYNLDGMSIAPISLSGIPDQMKGDKSNVVLANPQIYMSINNPVAANGVHYDAGLLLRTVRTGYNDIDYRPQREITVGANHGDGPYNFLLAPDFENRLVPTEPVDYSKNLEFVAFPTLSNLLTTPEGFPVKGMPESIEVEIENPGIPSQDVENFRLKPIDGVTGHYTVMAPLALKSEMGSNEKSFIFYSDRRDGWNDDGDLDKLTVTTFEITANAMNNCPVDVQLTVYPLTRDKKGNVKRTGASLTSNTIPSGKQQALTFTLDGEIENLDGFDIEALMTGTDNQSPLAPGQTLDLTEIKAKVNGYYETDFE